MKKIILALALVVCTTGAFAAKPKAEKKDEGFKFTTIKEVPITPIKNQHRSSTCWAFSSFGFLEAEVLREKGITVDLAEMYLVSWSMQERGELYVRLHGNATFAPGGAFADAIACLRDHGLVPQDAMPGYDSLPNHSMLDNVARAYIDAIATKKYATLNPRWLTGFKAIYDTFLGERPEKFVVDGTEMTPREYADDYLGLNADDYVSITSFTHHPFYSQFSIEIEDNWRNSLSYNVPMEEMMEIMEYAIDNGYTIAWGADVSENGFTRNGVAVMPDETGAREALGSDMAHWLGLSLNERKNELTSRPLPELTITQEMRQTAFDNWETTDDHGMLIYGKAKDQNGKEYFLVKNSWGSAGAYNGIWYASEAFVAYKTMNIVVNKKAIPAAIAAKLGL